MKLYKRIWHGYTGYTWFCFHHRVDPVPYTRCHRASGRGCYRKPQTTSERRANLDHELRDLIRSRRRKLVSAWDDIQRSMYPKGWKDCTKKKYQWL